MRLLIQYVLNFVVKYGVPTCGRVKDFGYRNPYHKCVFDGKSM